MFTNVKVTTLVEISFKAHVCKKNKTTYICLIVFKLQQNVIRLQNVKCKIVKSKINQLTPQSQ